MYELKRPASGTYVAVLPTPGTQALLDDWAKRNCFELDHGLHVTLLYSRETLDIKTDSLAEFVGTPIGFDRFGDSIVVKLASPMLTARHAQFIAQGGTHDFPQFQPHVTIAYAGGKIKHEDLDPIEFCMAFNAEYTESII